MLEVLGTTSGMIQDNTENELDQATIDTPLYWQINFIIL